VFLIQEPHQKLEPRMMDIGGLVNGLIWEGGPGGSYNCYMYAG
jgi:hypothetical protein